MEFKSESKAADVTVTVQLTDHDGLIYTEDFEVEALPLHMAEDFRAHHDAIMAMVDGDVTDAWEQHPGQKYEIIAVDY